MNTLQKVLIASLMITGAADSAWAEDKSKAQAQKKEEASIGFINQRQSIKSWQADGMDGLWIEDARGQWYYATMFAPCEGLDFAFSLAFETKTTSSLDKFGSVVVPDVRRCAFSSLTKSDAPPEKEKKPKKAK